MKEQLVVLVDERDAEVGTMEKMEAHRKGLLHRAFSVFIFDRSGRMLLQQRAAGKYHGALLWTNACCSHPYPGEANGIAATRRLQEELGFTTELQEIFSFTYRAEVENGLTEHEFDHVFAGTFEGEIDFNRDEVQDVAYRNLDDIEREVQQYPERFTTWFRIALPKLSEWARANVLPAGEKRND